MLRIRLLLALLLFWLLCVWLRRLLLTLLLLLALLLLLLSGGRLLGLILRALFRSGLLSLLLLLTGRGRCALLAARLRFLLRLRLWRGIGSRGASSRRTGSGRRFAGFGSLVIQSV